MRTNDLNNVSTELQSIGMLAIRKVLEESDFLKMLINIYKLSQHFYAYSLSVSKKQSSLVGLIFDALENPFCVEDALKSLLVTIRIQDYYILNNYKSDLSEIEMQRFILLLPYLMQQFMIIIGS